MRVMTTMFRDYLFFLVGHRDDDEKHCFSFKNKSLQQIQIGLEKYV